VSRKRDATRFINWQNTLKRPRPREPPVVRIGTDSAHVTANDVSVLSPFR
jgi:hypothetical protein